MPSTNVLIFQGVMALSVATFFLTVLKDAILEPWANWKFQETIALARNVPQSSRSSEHGDVCANDWTKSDNVWMVETGGRPISDSTISCAMESVATKMPQFCIRLVNISANAGTLTINPVTHLSATNVMIVHVASLEKLFPYNYLSYFFSFMIAQSPCKMNHLSDVLRFLLVYEYGGIYVDTDVIALRRLDNAAKFVVRNNNREKFATTMFRFQRASTLVWRLLERSGMEYKQGEYFSIVGTLIRSTQLLCQYACGVEPQKIMGNPDDDEPFQCCDVKIFNNKFGQCKTDLTVQELNETQCSIYHYALTWGARKREEAKTEWKNNRTGTITPNQQIEELSKMHCPETVKVCGRLQENTLRERLTNGIQNSNCHVA